MAINIQKKYGGIRIGKVFNATKANRIQIKRETRKLEVKRPKSSVLVVKARKSPVVVRSAKRVGVQISKSSPVVIKHPNPSKPSPKSAKTTPRLAVKRVSSRSQSRNAAQKTAHKAIGQQEKTPKKGASNIRVNKEVQEEKKTAEPQFTVSLRTPHAPPKLHPSFKPKDKSKPLLIVSARKRKLKQEQEQRQKKLHHVDQKRQLERDMLEQARMNQREKARQQARIKQKKRLQEQLEMRRIKLQAATTTTEKRGPSPTKKNVPSQKAKHPPVAVLSRALKNVTKRSLTTRVSKGSSAASAKKRKTWPVDLSPNNKRSKVKRRTKQSSAANKPRAGTDSKNSSLAVRVKVTDKKFDAKAPSAATSTTSSAVKITKETAVTRKNTPVRVSNNKTARSATPAKSKPGVSVKTPNAAKKNLKNANKTGSRSTLKVTREATSPSPSPSQPSTPRNTRATPTRAGSGSKSTRKTTGAAAKTATATRKQKVSLKRVKRGTGTETKRTPKKRQREPTPTLSTGKKSKTPLRVTKSKASPGAAGGTKIVVNAKATWKPLPQRRPRDRSHRHATPMLEVDGAIMEGGGQILRQTVATALLFEKSIHIKNIRGKRSSPGLRPQHLAVLKLMKRICQGTLRGDGSKPLDVGTTAITIAPQKGWMQLKQSAVGSPGVGKKRSRGASDTADGIATHFCELSTAGSMMLMLQASLPCLLFLNQSTRIVLKGGTDVPFSPPLDFVTMVVQPLLRTMGADVKLLQPEAGAKKSSPGYPRYQRGVYPQGGGCLEFLVQSMGAKCLRPIKRVTQGKLIKLRAKVMVMARSKSEATSAAQAIVKDLDTHLMDAITDFNEFGAGAEVPDIDVKTEICVAEPSAHKSKRSSGNSDMNFGAAVVVCAETSTGCLISGDAIAISKPQAKRVSENAVSHLMEALRCGSCMSEHALNHLVLFMALARGTSWVRCSAPVDNSHLATSIHFAQQMTGAKFQVLTDYHDPSADPSHADAESSLDLMAGVEEKTVVIQCDGCGFKGFTSNNS